MRIQADGMAAMPWLCPTRTEAAMRKATASRRPITVLEELLYDPATKRFALRFKPHNSAARLLHQPHLGDDGVHTWQGLEPWQLDMVGLSVTTVIEAMQRPGEWVKASLRPATPWIVSNP